MSKIQPVRGTKDYFFHDQQKFTKIVEISRQVTECFGYQEASTPIFEFTEVFKRTLGNFSDIVNKEMYSFEDRKGQSITLRPEFTACIMRAIISNGLFNQLPLRLFSWGPLFRYERPQRGRMRQFHQINCEYIGSDNPLADVEIISMASMILNDLNISKDITLEINSLGDNETRSKYIEDLVKYYQKYVSELSEESKLRLEKNPLRILDSKDENDKKINHSAPKITEYLNYESKKYFDAVLENLAMLGIDYNINNLMVRGLDYYNHTTFEFITEKLGAQGTVLAGGRYNGLLQLMGGKDAPGIGFGGGIERLAELYAYEGKQSLLLSVIALKEELLFHANKLAYILRKEGIATIIENSFNLSKALKKALDRGVKYALFIGEDEIKNNKFKIKNFATREEQDLELTNLITMVKQNEF